MRVFMNGKQKWVRREPTIDGMDVDEWIARNADPIWLVQNEMWEFLDRVENVDLESLYPIESLEVDDEPPNDAWIVNDRPLEDEWLLNG